jgi:hypothetical protein
MATKKVSREVQGLLKLSYDEDAPDELKRKAEEEEKLMHKYDRPQNRKKKAYPVKKPKRLEILEKTNDGFVIAEEDLKLRGPGDLF